MKSVTTPGGYATHDALNQAGALQDSDAFNADRALG